MSSKLIDYIDYAMVWGQSVKHAPQRVGLSHMLEDEDVIQIVKKRGTVKELDPHNQSSESSRSVGQLVSQSVKELDPHNQSNQSVGRSVSQSVSQRARLPLLARVPPLTSTCTCTCTCTRECSRAAGLGRCVVHAARDPNKSRQQAKKAKAKLKT